MTTIPQAAIDAAREALTRCLNSYFPEHEGSEDYILGEIWNWLESDPTLAKAALEAAAPLITAAERERIRELAERTRAVCAGEDGT